MSLGFVYNVFDGAELLSPSIKSIRNVVDEIVVVYQTVSYYGNTIEEYDIAEVVEAFENSGLVDKSIHLDFSITAKNSLEAKLMERKKYQKGLEYLDSKGIEYFHFAATDEFFHENELKKSLEFVRKNDIHRSFCKIQTYSDIHLKDEDATDDVSANLFYKNLGLEYFLGLNQGDNPIYIDAVGSYGKPGRDYIFEPEEIMMHHYRLSRIDNSVKLENSSISNKTFLKNQIENIERIRSRAKECENIFNIDFKGFKERFYKS